MTTEDIRHWIRIFELFFALKASVKVFGSININICYIKATECTFQMLCVNSYLGAVQGNHTGLQLATVQLKSTNFSSWMMILNYLTLLGD